MRRKKWPSVDSTQMRPPCISTICLAIASPRPVALVLELHLVELIKDPRLMLRGATRPSICEGYGEVTVRGLAVTRTSPASVNLMQVLLNLVGNAKGATFQMELPTRAEFQRSGC
jgi:hypothetical protein